MFGWLRRSLRPIRWLAAAAIITAALISCASGEDSTGRQAITVFAAASLTEAFTELAGAFEEERPGLSVKLNFDGSQRLRFQLEHGARAEVFASADRKQMDRARDSGLLATEIIDFASNRLVLIVPDSDSGAEIDEGVKSLSHSTAKVGTGVESLADLSRKGVKLALAHPEAPVGRYSRTLIHRIAEDTRFGAEYAGSVLKNVVTEEPNVRSVLQKVVLGEVDAGFVYYSDVQVASDISVIQLPDEANVLAGYTVAALKNSDWAEFAEAFIDFILSEPGQGILSDHGFGPPISASQSRRPGSREDGIALMVNNDARPGPVSWAK